MRKRLVFCFDGTWNKLDAPYPTNVVITAESVIPTAADGTAQIIYYDEGVGTGKFEVVAGGLFGAGLVKNIGDAYRSLIFNYMPGDEIYIFGFSRGAYSARSFVGLLKNCGILRRRDAARVNEAIVLYRLPKETPGLDEKKHNFRRDYSIDLHTIEDSAWKGASVPEIKKLRIKYLGVWDTVGSLGIPKRYTLGVFNKKHQFHDTSLSMFVERAWHAVAIDEHRLDFEPTLWDNTAALNTESGVPDSSDIAPYQQKWFPGVHGAVGGGGLRRGLSDQALDWIWDGARHAGLVLDASRSSRIYELSPSHADDLNNTDEKPGLGAAIMKLMRRADRSPGPSELYELSTSTKRRWLDNPANLPHRRLYRPATLNNVAQKLMALKPGDLGVGQSAHDEAGDTGYVLHQVVADDQLRALAKRYYGDPNLESLIFDANRNKIEHRDRIYVGQVLRIPKLPTTLESTPAPPVEQETVL